MTPEELTDIDERIAKARGWKPESKWWYAPKGHAYEGHLLSCPSPTRRTADAWALLEWCIGQGHDVEFGPDSPACIIRTIGDCIQGDHEYPAIALSIAVVAMLDAEGKT